MQGNRKCEQGTKNDKHEVHKGPIVCGSYGILLPCVVLCDLVWPCVVLCVLFAMFWLYIALSRSHKNSFGFVFKFRSSPIVSEH